MKLISLYFCDELTTTFEGITYKFIKGATKEVPSGLADKLLKTGEFIEIINDFSVQVVISSPCINPEPLIVKKKRRKCKSCPE